MQPGKLLNARRQFHRREPTQMPPPLQSCRVRQGSPKEAMPAVHSCGCHAKPLAQLPATGPVCVDETQRPVAPHQPQPLTGVQPAQEVNCVQGSSGCGGVPASGTAWPEG